MAGTKRLKDGLSVAQREARQALVDKPFMVVTLQGKTREARAYGIVYDEPTVEVGKRGYSGLSWRGLHRAVTQGEPVYLNTLEPDAL